MSEYAYKKVIMIAVACFAIGCIALTLVCPLVFALPASADAADDTFYDKLPTGMYRYSYALVDLSFLDLDEDTDYDVYLYFDKLGGFCSFYYEGGYYNIDEIEFNIASDGDNQSHFITVSTQEDIDISYLVEDNEVVAGDGFLFVYADIEVGDYAIVDYKSFLIKSFLTVFKPISNFAFDMGFEDGTEEGISLGYSMGYAEGKDFGFDEGYDSGYSVGVTDGYADGIAFADGRVNKQSASYFAGRADGENYAFRLGYDEGYNEGYDKGYAEGVYNTSPVLPPLDGYSNTRWLLNDTFVSSGLYGSLPASSTDELLATISFNAVFRVYDYTVEGPVSYDYNFNADYLGYVVYAPSGVVGTETGFGARVSAVSPTGLALYDMHGKALHSTVYVTFGDNVVLSDSAIAFLSNNAIRVALTEDYTDGYYTGFAIGSQESYSRGYDIGYATGKQVAHDTVIKTSASYNAGYSQGVNDAGSYTFNGLLSSVIDVPVNAFKQFFDFEIFGTNLSGFFSALFVIAIIVTILRVVIR